MCNLVEPVCDLLQGILQVMGYLYRDLLDKDGDFHVFEIFDIEYRAL